MTKLTALDIRVYDYVQAYSKEAKRFSMPMYVDSIFGEETVYLTFNGNEADPWEENTEDLYALDIDEKTLRQFGFEKYGESYVLDKEWYRIIVKMPDCGPIQVTIFNRTSFNDFERSTGCKYIHDIQHFFYDKMKKALRLEWGVDALSSRENERREVSDDEGIERK